MTPAFADLFVRAVPDIDSWFMVRLRLEEVVTAPFEAREGVVDRGEPTSGIEDARRRAQALAGRFLNGLEVGMPEESLEREYALPALLALQQAGSIRDVLELAASLAGSLERVGSGASFTTWHGRYQPAGRASVGAKRFTPS